MKKFPDNIRPSISRVCNNKFTEADIRSLIVDWRQNAGPIMKEIGDLIAHPQKDRGWILDHMVHSYSKMAFFSKYKTDQAIPFPMDGTCDWWLKSYMLHQVNNFDDKEIKKILE